VGGPQTLKSGLASAGKALCSTPDDALLDIISHEWKKHLCSPADVIFIVGLVTMLLLSNKCVPEPAPQHKKVDGRF
jgi:hypothetical protein